MFTLLLLLKVPFLIWLGLLVWWNLIGKPLGARIMISSLREFFYKSINISTTRGSRFSSRRETKKMWLHLKQNMISSVCMASIILQSNHFKSNFIKKLCQCFILPSTKFFEKFSKLKNLLVYTQNISFLVIFAL